LEQEISNLKFNKVELLSEENKNLEPRSVYQEAILYSFLDFAEKKKELIGYSRACFLNDWTIPFEYQTMLRSEAYFKINQLISQHENAVLAWENCFKNLREKLAVLWSQFNSEIKPLMSDLGSSEPKLERAIKLAEKSLKGIEVVVEETFPNVKKIPF
jgi:hypothetical protein